MTLLAALFMSISVASVTALTVWCYYRVLSQSRSKGHGNDGPGREADT